MQVTNSLKSRLVRLPVASSTDLVAGSLMIKGTTYGAGTNTDVGVCIINAADSADGVYVGILAEPHIYSKNGSALLAGAAHSAVIPNAVGAAWFAPVGGDSSIFPSRLIELVAPVTLCRIDYAQTGIAITSSSTTAITAASGEEGIGTGFLYCSAGEGVGELRCIATTNTNTWTTSVAFTTLTSAGYLVKIPPLLHGLVVLTVGNTTTPTKIDTTLAAGAARMIQLERHIVRDNVDEMLDPYTHKNLSGLDHLTKLEFYGVFSMASTVFQPLA